MIFLIIIKNTLSKIEMPNTVLGDASRLIPDPNGKAKYTPHNAHIAHWDLGSVRKNNSG